MGREIERKYLVGSDGWRNGADDGERIIQGYLSLDPDRTVRVRLRGDDGAVLTIKGRNDGPTRPEFEYDIPREEAEQLIGLCVEPVVDKVRHEYEIDGLTWEIDVFGGENDGLVLAEVELDDERVVPDVPEWIEQDVTDDPSFYNANLVQHPRPRPRR